MTWNGMVFAAGQRIRLLTPPLAIPGRPAPGFRAPLPRNALMASSLCPGQEPRTMP